MKRLTTFLATTFLASGLASANPAPEHAPIPAWVEQVSLPEADPARQDAPVQLLLLSGQVRNGDAGLETYAELATIIQQPQGLAAGNITIPWAADRVDLFIHKAEIIRGGATRDLLKDGKEFTVLRRESNLEGAMLDGTLTAVMQPDDLRVGDTLVLAYSMREKPGQQVPADTSLISPIPGTKIRRMFYRRLWSDGETLNWRASNGMADPKIKKTGAGNELRLDLTDIEPPPAPKNAPIRFALPPQLQMSPYSGWNEVGALMAPAYQKARSIGAESPLRGEIRRIAASSPDKKKQAMAALRTVQDKIRYFAVMIGQGGYLPASADDTWSRTYGDCKGKTAALLALLDGLGIEAEPVLINTVIGDTLRDRLPTAELFDHVLVRAVIDGQDYWLDGTRSGDRNIDALKSLPYGWGLPIRATASALIQLPLAPPPAPLTETETVYDASKGLLAPVRVSHTITYRGEVATYMRLALGQVGEAKMRAEIDDNVSDLPKMSDRTIDFRFDEDAGTFVIEASGTTLMDWANGGSSFAFRFDDETIEWAPDFERDKPSDAPFALVFPMFLQSRQTIILPDNGAGFEMEGKDFDVTVAGTQIARSLKLENGRAVATSVFRRLSSEITAETARASAKPLKTIEDDEALLRAPAAYAMNSEQKKLLKAWTPGSADDLVERGYQLMQVDDYKAAIKDFDRASELDPASTIAPANKALSLLHLGRLDEAKATLEKLSGMDGADEELVVHQANGLLATMENRPADAVKSFTRALRLEPGNRFAMAQRIEAYDRLGRYDDAILDVDDLLAADAEDAYATYVKSQLLIRMGQADAGATLAKQGFDAAGSMTERASYAMLLKAAGKEVEASEAYKTILATLDQERAAMSDEAERMSTVADRVSLLAASGDLEQAIALVDRSLRDAPDSPARLNTRCWLRATAGVELDKALKDCDLGLKNDPENAAIADSRGFVKLRMGRFDEAIADFDLALGWEPRLAAALYARGIAKRRKGDLKGGDADIAAARSVASEVDLVYRTYGIEP